MKTILIIILSLPFLSLAATSDFTANSNISVSGVTFGLGSTSMVIMNGSTAESWLFNSGAFTVTNPGSAFNVSSTDSAVKSIQVTSGATTLLCSENTTPGTSYATLPTTTGTYTVLPSATTACSSLCTVLSNTATYNAFPTCGALSCNTGYQISGSGASATCMATPPSGSSQVVGGGPSAPSAEGIPGYVKPRLQTVYPDGSIVYLDATSSAPTSTTSSTAGSSKAYVSATFTKNLALGSSSNDVRRLQALLSLDKKIYPQGIVNGRYGPLTQKAVKLFQLKYNVVKSSKDAGYGVVGPKTRAKLQAVFAH